MSAGYTPAPWDADWFAKLLRDLHNQPYADYLADEQRDGFNYPGWSLNNDGADARLIAAAPTLVEAVEALVECFIKRGPFDEPLGASEQAPSINAGIAALSLARGEQARNDGCLSEGDG